MECAKWTNWLTNRHAKMACGNLQSFTACVASALQGVSTAWARTIKHLYPTFSTQYQHHKSNKVYVNLNVLMVMYIDNSKHTCCTYMYRGRIQRKTWWMGPYAGVDFNLTICPLQSRLQHFYHGQLYARVDFFPQSGTLNLASEITNVLCKRKKRRVEVGGLRQVDIFLTS